MYFNWKKIIYINNTFLHTHTHTHTNLHDKSLCNGCFSCLNTILTFLQLNTFSSSSNNCHVCSLLYELDAAGCWTRPWSLHAFFSLDPNAVTAVLLLLLFSSSSVEDFFSSFTSIFTSTVCTI